MTAKFRPNVKILAASMNDHIVHQMNAVRGVVGLKVASNSIEADLDIEQIIEEAKKLNLCSDGGKVVVIKGVSNDKTNVMRILNV